MESLIISHTSDESTLFVDGHIQTDTQFTQFINSLFPPYAQAAGINKIVEAYYPSLATSNKYGSESERVVAMVRESTFTCNVRHLTEAYGDSKVWNMQYSVTPGWHATDLVPTFYNAAGSLDSLLENVFFTVVPLFTGMAWAYQSYLTSYVKTGNPNTERRWFNIPSAISWGHPNSKAEKITGVLDVGNSGFSIVEDSQDPMSSCHFWRDIGAAVTSLGGYAAPGAVVGQNLVKITNDPSANYKTK